MKDNIIITGSITSVAGLRQNDIAGDAHPTAIAPKAPGRPWPKRLWLAKRIATSDACPHFSPSRWSSEGPPPDAGQNVAPPSGTEATDATVAINVLFLPLVGAIAECDWGRPHTVRLRQLLRELAAHVRVTDLRRFQKQSSDT